MQVRPVQIDASAGITGGASSGSAGTKGDGSGSLMGVSKSDFLELLVAQLRNQDPLKPMEDREFIAQMAQLNTVEQLATMNTELSKFVSLETIAQASALIGKTVEASQPGGNVVSGVVQEVRLEQGKPVLMVNGQKVNVSDVQTIT